MERRDLVIAGAGAAGLLCCAMLPPGREVLLLEGRDKPGKKLLTTGNGRCNLSNRDIRPVRYHGDTALAAPVLERWPAQKVLSVFRELGLLTREESEGRLYPASLQAAAVLRCLWSACERRGVEFSFGSGLTDVEKTKDGFLLRLESGREISCRQLVLACGGRSAIGQRPGGDGYALAKKLGHSVTPLRPSLVPLRSSSPLCRSLKGQRVRCSAALLLDGKELSRERGELIFGDGQLSGICVLNLSAHYDGGPGRWELSLDLLEDMNQEELAAYLAARRKAEEREEELLAGAVNLRVGQALLKSLGEKAPCEAIASKAKDWRFPVIGTAGWASAQVTAGGVPLSQVDAGSMQSKQCAGLYLLGELLNLDGDCGGFNLHWAWATALSCAESLSENK